MPSALPKASEAMLITFARLYGPDRVRRVFPRDQMHKTSFDSIMADYLVWSGGIPNPWHLFYLLSSWGTWTNVLGLSDLEHMLFTRSKKRDFAAQVAGFSFLTLLNH